MQSDEIQHQSFDAVVSDTGHSEQFTIGTLQKLKNCLKVVLYQFLGDVDISPIFFQIVNEKKKKERKKKNIRLGPGSNPRPATCYVSALPTELQRHL